MCYFISLFSQIEGLFYYFSYNWIMLSYWHCISSVSIMVVLFFISFVMLWWAFCLVILSMFDMTLSIISIWDSFMYALVRSISSRSPWLRLLFSSDIIVSYCSGSFIMYSWLPTSFAALIISSWVMCSVEYAMLSLTVALIIEF